MEQLISFETAKLAKRKEFNQRVSQVYYFASKEITKDDEDSFNMIPEYYSDFRNSADKFYISAPSQSQLQKWLREEKRCIVYVTPIDSWDSWKYTILMEDVISPFFEPEYDRFNEYKSYEEALETGLKTALELI